LTESQLPSSHSPNHCQLPVTHYRDPPTLSLLPNRVWCKISYYFLFPLGTITGAPSLGTNFVEQVPRTWSKVSFVR
jgi:hypothetical protein